MADASWVHLGRDYTYGLIVEGRIVGLAYWRDAEILDEDAQHEPAVNDPAVNDPGWFWTATENPWERRRVAQGLELTAEMGEEELGQTVGDALEVIPTEVLAEEGDNARHRGSPNDALVEAGGDESPHRGSDRETPVLVAAGALALVAGAVTRRRRR